MTKILVLALAASYLWSVVLFFIAVFVRDRKQELGFGYSLVGAWAFVAAYCDHFPGKQLKFRWLAGFFPELAERKPATLFTPATVSDRTDGQITHLDGLNLSRAWCWRTLANALPKGDKRRAHAEGAFEEHVQSALPHVTGDYMGEHWLATFALLAMTE